MGEVQSETWPASELTWRRPICGPRARMYEDAARAFDELVGFGSKVFGTCHFSRRNGSEPRYDTAIRSRRHSFVGGCAGDRRSDLRAKRKSWAGSAEPTEVSRRGEVCCKRTFPLPCIRAHFTHLHRWHGRRRDPDSVPLVSTLATTIALGNERGYPLPRSSPSRAVRRVPPVPLVPPAAARCFLSRARRCSSRNVGVSHTITAASRPESEGRSVEATVSGARGYVAPIEPLGIVVRRRSDGRRFDREREP